MLLINWKKNIMGREKEWDMELLNPSWPQGRPDHRHAGIFWKSLCKKRKGHKGFEPVKINLSSLQKEIQKKKQKQIQKSQSYIFSQITLREINN